MEFDLPPLYAVQRLADGTWLVRTQMGDPILPGCARLNDPCPPIGGVKPWGELGVFWGAKPQAWGALRSDLGIGVAGLWPDGCGKVA